MGKRRDGAAALLLTAILLFVSGSCMPVFAEADTSNEGVTKEENGAGVLITEVKVYQEAIDAYVQAVSKLPAYIGEENASQVLGLLGEADALYNRLGEAERAEAEVIAAHKAWSNMVEQSQNTALTAGAVTVMYVDPGALGEIENLVPRQGTSGPESEGFALDAVNSNAANGQLSADVLHNQGTGGNQEMIQISGNGVLLNSDAKLTVRYTNIGTYYEGRIYTSQNVIGIQVNAIVTISNPYNADRISLYENFWMGGTVNGGSGRMGYSAGTPGRADVSITFCDENWNVIALEDDAQLIASSISHGYYKGCSYEGISFTGAEGDTTVRIYSQSHGNIGIDTGTLFGLEQTFYGELVNTSYCSGSGGPHSGGHDYVDTRNSGTFMVHGVGFHQDSTVWKMTMTTQTVYSGGHDYWFYFTAAPVNMARPEAPVKTVSSETARIREDITYTLLQKLSTVQSDGYGYYGSLVFYDTLPVEVDFRSARMYLDGEDVTQSAGTLTYNSEAGKVTYTFSPEYLQNMSYSGQTAKLVITCQLNGSVEGKSLVTNEGFVSVCGDVESATAHFIPEYEATGSVRVTKRILASDIVFSHGNPTFLFRLEGTDGLGSGRICYRTVTFTPEYVAMNTGEDGYVIGTATFSDLLPGIYEVTEEETNRYALEQITEVTNGTAEGTKVTFDLMTNQDGAAVFTNVKYEQGGISDSCFVENKIK